MKQPDFDDADITWAEPEGVFRQPDTSVIFTYHNDYNNRKDTRKPILYEREPEMQLPGCPDGEFNPHARLELEEKQARLGSGLQGIKLPKAPKRLGPGISRDDEKVSRSIYQEMYAPQIPNIDQVRGRPIMPLNLENATPSMTVPWSCGANESQFQQAKPVQSRKIIAKPPGTYKKAVQELINTGSDRSLREALRPEKSRPQSAHGSEESQTQQAMKPSAVVSRERPHASDVAGVKGAESRETSVQVPVPKSAAAKKPTLETFSPQVGSNQQPVRSRVSKHIAGREIRSPNTQAPMVQGQTSRAPDPKQIVRIRDTRTHTAMPAVSSHAGSSKVHTPKTISHIQRITPSSQTGAISRESSRRVQPGRSTAMKKPIESGPATGTLSGAQQNVKHSRSVRRNGKASREQEVDRKLDFTLGNQYELMESSDLSDSDDDGTERYAYFTR